MHDKLKPFSIEEYQQDPSVKYNRINDRDALLQEIAPSVKKGLSPDLIRDGQWYLNWLNKCMDETYIEEIASYLADEPKLRNLPPETDNIVIMPVGATGDVERIYNTLAKYSTQDSSHDGMISILLWVNMLEDQVKDPQSLKLADTTYEEIEAAKKNFTSLNIIDLYYGTSPEDVAASAATGGPWGIIMRKFYDVAALAAFHHVGKDSNSHSDMLIIRNDSDPIELGDQYLHHWKSAVRDLEDYAGYQGMSRFGDNNSREALFPGLSLIMNLIPVFDKYVGDHLRFQAANFAFKASAYCQMGGMGTPYYTGIGSCDALLGERLKNVMKLREEKGGAGPSTIGLVPAKLKTDWSRPLAAYLDGRNPQRAWTTWSDSPSGIKDRNSDLSTFDMDQKEGFTTSISKVEENIDKLLARLTLEESHRLLTEFFGDTNTFRLAGMDHGAKFCFTKEGIEKYKIYFDSDLPYDKYISSNSGNDSPLRKRQDT